MTADLNKLWAILTPPERRRALLMLALVVLMALAETAGVVSIMPFLSVLARPEVVHENRWLQIAYTATGARDTRHFIVLLGLASIALVLASSAFKTVTLHLVNRFIAFLRHSISVRLLSRYLHQPYEFFLQHNPSALSRNVLSEVDQLQVNLISPLSQLIAQGFIVLAMVVLLLAYNPLIALALVAVVALLYGVIYRLVRGRLGRIGRERQQANGQRFQACNEALGGIKDVKVTQAADAYQQRFTEASRQYARHIATSETLSSSPLYLVEAVGYTGLITLALVLMLSRGDIAHVLPALGLYGFAAYRMLPAAQVMYRGFAKLKFSSAALEAIHQHLTLPTQQDDGNAIEAPLQLQHEIRLQGVHYAYPSAPDKPVLDDFNLVIPAHTSVGIVGASGSGKSTLMDVLLGLLQPQAGTLSVDGVPITPVNVGAWQRAIGFVPQHIYLADASVAENIAFGLPTDQIDMEAVQQAARAAQIHDFVAHELPQGYDTPVGDRGIRLSGGQRQRVGIARALYRDPALIFMDEATSALDTETEKAITEAVSSLSGERTMIIIAHRKISLQKCDEIIDIDQNK